VLRERFIGFDGKSERITPEGSEPLKVRACSSLSQAVVSTTHPWTYFTQSQREVFENICNAARMSYFGGDCYAYALLASGFIDIVIEGRLAPWDVAALVPVIEGAGGIVTDWDGNAFNGGASIIASGDARAHDEAVKMLKGQG
jgi:myo-inositol-1(or 4)-monophosphatase